MIESYFLSMLGSGKYVQNLVFFRKLRDGYIVTTEFGSWIFLSGDDFKSFRRGKVEPGSRLFSELESKGMIATESNTDSIKNSYVKKFNALIRGTSLHIIVPTLRCNQKCVYCHSSVASYSQSDEYDMDEETYKKTVDFIFQSPSNTITIEFQGGDSMLNKGLFKNIVEYAKKKNNLHQKHLYFSLVSNSTLYDRDIIEFIDKNKISMCSSLDGPKELHNKNRCFECGFGEDAFPGPVEDNRRLLISDFSDNHKAVTDTFEILDKEYGKRINFMMVTTRASLSEYKEIIDEYVRLGQKGIQLKYIHKLGFAENSWKTVGYSIDEFIDFWKKSMDYILELNKKGILLSERYVVILLKKIIRSEDPGFLDLRNPCGMIIGQLAYNYNGDIYSCDEGRNFEEFRLGNVKTDRYKDVLESDKSLNLINSSMLENYACTLCAYRPYCGTCPVINYAESGNIIPKLPLNSKCRFHMAMFDYVFDKLIFDEAARKIFFDWLSKLDEK